VGAHSGHRDESVRRGKLACREASRQPADSEFGEPRVSISTTEVT
jgi:hypothetical protein